MEDKDSAELVKKMQQLANQLEELFAESKKQQQIIGETLGKLKNGKMEIPSS